MAKKPIKKTNSPLHFLSQLVELSSTSSPFGGDEHPSTPPRIVLLQSSHSLPLRLDASSSLSSAQEKDVYERAGVRTPAETARRDFLGGTHWLSFVVDEIVAQQHQSVNNSSNNESPSSIDCRILWIAHREGKGPSSAFQAKYPNVMIEVLRAANDPWGWERGGDSDVIDNSEAGNEVTREIGKESAIRLDDLNYLSSKINDRIKRLTAQENHSAAGAANTIAKPATRVVVVWENLSPLLLNHGVESTLRFVQSCCRGCLVLLPVLNELLTPAQHTRFEDAASACLWLNQGEITLIRKGVREAGNVIRETVDFDLVHTVSNLSVPGDGSNNAKSKVVIVEKSTPSSPSSTFENATKVADIAGDGSSSGRIEGSRPGKIQLRLEPEPGKSSDTISQIATFTTVFAVSDSSTTNTSVTRPRIYLQDDDPEFDDLDEEDPDDDLDI